jgi:ABC-type uncharacterized transport system YnjBCD ATPase subunit
MTVTAEQKRLHFDLSNVGLRAQATASGLVQLCRELQQAGVLQDDALVRIKSAIADEIAFNAPRSIKGDDHRQHIGRRLDSIFAGTSKIGSADNIVAPSEAPS